jgi:hypothetical protein
VKKKRNICLPAENLSAQTALKKIAKIVGLPHFLLIYLEAK